MNLLLHLPLSLPLLFIAHLFYHLLLLLHHLKLYQLLAQGSQLCYLFGLICLYLSMQSWIRQQAMEIQLPLLFQLGVPELGLGLRLSYLCLLLVRGLGLNLGLFCLSLQLVQVLARARVQIQQLFLQQEEGWVFFVYSLIWVRVIWTQALIQIQIVWSQLLVYRLWQP